MELGDDDLLPGRPQRAGGAGGGVRGEWPNMTGHERNSSDPRVPVISAAIVSRRLLTSPDLLQWRKIPGPPRSRSTVVIRQKVKGRVGVWRGVSMSSQIMKRRQEMCLTCISCSHRAEQCLRCVVFLQTFERFVHFWIYEYEFNFEFKSPGWRGPAPNRYFIGTSRYRCCLHSYTIW